MRSSKHLLRVACALGLLGCGGVQTNMPPERRHAANDPPTLDIRDEWLDPEATYTASAAALGRDRDMSDARVNERAPTIAIVGGTVLTVAGQRFERGTVILSGGRITAVGPGSISIPAGARVIDAAGRFVTPGIIDSHSHIGVYSVPGADAHQDGNELSAPVTAHVRAEYGYWPQDPAIPRALAGGVTTAQILPGSANLIGGLGFTVAMRPGATAASARFPGAPATLKMACGENPKRVYGQKGGPATRMAEYAAFRQAFHQARDYHARWAAYERDRAMWLKKRARAAELDAEAEKAGKGARIAPVPAPQPPTRDLGMDTLSAVLRGDVLVQIHCYRAPEMAELVALADEFGFRIRSFHHALEAYKIRDLLVAHDIGINTWADWWGFKLEAFDGIPENAALFTASGGRAVIHSDSPVGIQRLNQEAAKAMHAGRNAGLDISEEQALAWITANPAWVLGIHEVTGTLETGKRADVVVWNRHPLSVYAKADTVIQAGEIVFQRDQGRTPTDYELGNSAAFHADRGAATATTKPAARPGRTGGAR